MELPNPTVESPGSTGMISSWGHRVIEFRTLPLSLVAPLLPFQYVDVSCGFLFCFVLFSCGFNGMIGFLNCLESLKWEGNVVLGERETRGVSATTKTMFFLQKANK